MKINKTAWGMVCVTLGMVFAASAQTALNNGLVSWWRFDETTGTTSRDASGNGNTATWGSGPVMGAGKLRNAIAYINNQNAATLNTMSLNQVTIAGWANVNWNYYQGGLWLAFIGSGTGLYEDPWGNMCFTVEGTTVTGPGLQGLWSFVCGVYDGTNVTLFINGVGVSSQKKIGAMINGKAVIGNHPTGGGYSFGWVGGIDDLRIYNRALSTNEVAELYGYESKGLLPACTAQATAILEEGRVVSAAITDAGSGYTNTPSVKIVGGGSGA